MATVYVPTGIPPFLAEPHEQQARPLFANVDMAVGPARRRRLFTAVPNLVNVALELTEEQMAEFEEWMEYDLQACSLPFTAQIARLGQGLQYVVATWETMPQKVPSQVNDWRVVGTLRVSPWIEAEPPPEPELPPSGLWKTETFQWGPQNISSPNSSMAGLYLSNENVILVLAYDDNSSWMAMHRRSTTDFSDLGTVANLRDTDPSPVPNPWDLDVTPHDAVDDPNGNYAYYGGWSGQLFRVNKTTWTLEEIPAPSVAVPAEYQPLVGASTMSSGYYRWMINPFNGDLYACAKDNFSVIHRIDKTNPGGAPLFTIWLMDPTFNLTSPYPAQPDVTSFYSILAAEIGNVIFTSATDAYVNDYNNSILFHLNLTTGAVTYVTKLVNEADEFSLHKPVAYDQTTNALWFYGTNSSHDFVLKGASLRKWVVGTDPSTIEDFPLRFDTELLIEGTTGSQEEARRQSQVVSHDTFNRGLWIVHQNDMFDLGYTEYSPQMRFFSFVDQTITMIADATEVTGATKGAPYGFGSFTMTSASKGWGVYSEIKPDEGGTANRYMAARITPQSDRPEPPVARYVRIIIESHAHLLHERSDTNFTGIGGPVGLQRIEVHSELNGPNVAVSVTASSEAPGFPASNLLDPTLTDPAIAWRAADTNYEHTLTIDLGSAVPVYEVAMWPINSRKPGLGAFSFIIVPEGNMIAPGSFRIETSNDGSTWVHRRRYIGVYAWPIGVNTSFDPPARRCFECF